MSRFGIWESVVPLTMKSPTEGTPDLSTMAPLFDDDDEKLSTSGGLEDDLDESLGDSAHFSHKRLKRKSPFHDNSKADSEDDDLIHQLETSKRMKDKHKGKREDFGKGKGDSATSGRLVTARM
jgi:chromosome transmission fidelity protein 4